MDEVLADVLVSNIVSNAVRYNIQGGFIRCVSAHNRITVTNSGLPITVDPEVLFRRFRKSSGSPQSVGLGLSIVRKIADNYGIDIKYTCTGNIHKIELLFPANDPS